MENIQFGAPLASHFQFPPSNEPQTLPPPLAGSTLSAPPFSISPSLYNAALDIKVPITIACVYAATVSLLNLYNRRAGNKAWGISKTKPFFWFVIAHNVFLAVYSAWTFVGMWKAISTSVLSPRGPAGLAGTLDGLCKIHGIPGLGNALTYSASKEQWISQSPASLYLSEAGTPDATDLGRLWNEGLAFYGWFFYLSKFYEVLDTLIILAKGKRSSTLQTYHHAGAMICMWAGIRYMSPPIWLFCFMNSGIHAMMYTYYTLTALSVQIPKALKQSLTTLQICQFVIGVTYAAGHSFISYTAPIQVLNSSTPLANVATAVSSTITSATDSSLSNLVKKMLFRAATPLPAYESHPISQQSDPSSLAQEYRTEYQTVSCIDTSGQTFAIWLNVLYLAPLTVLFVRFFIKSYLRRSGKMSSAAEKAERAGKDALKGVGRELYSDRKAKVNGSANGSAKGSSKGSVNGSANGSVKGSPRRRA